MRNGTKEVKFIIDKKGTMQYLQVLRSKPRNLRNFFFNRRKNMICGKVQRAIAKPFNFIFSLKKTYLSKVS